MESYPGPLSGSIIVWYISVYIIKTATPENDWFLYRSLRPDSTMYIYSRIVPQEESSTFLHFQSHTFIYGKRIVYKQWFISCYHRVGCHHLVFPDICILPYGLQLHILYITVHSQANRIPYQDWVLCIGGIYRYLNKSVETILFQYIHIGELGSFFAVYVHTETAF